MFAIHCYCYREPIKIVPIEWHLARKVLYLIQNKFPGDYGTNVVEITVTEACYGQWQGSLQSKTSMFWSLWLALYRSLLGRCFWSRCWDFGSYRYWNVPFALLRSYSPQLRAFRIWPKLVVLWERVSCQFDTLDLVVIKSFDCIWKQKYFLEMDESFKQTKGNLKQRTAKRRSKKMNYW